MTFTIPLLIGCQRFLSHNKIQLPAVANDREPGIIQQPLVYNVVTMPFSHAQATASARECTPSLE
jgi:hypothetical protein